MKLKQLESCGHVLDEETGTLYPANVDGSPDMSCPDTVMGWMSGGRCTDFEEFMEDFRNEGLSHEDEQVIRACYVDELRKEAEARLTARAMAIFTLVEELEDIMKMEPPDRDDVLEAWVMRHCKLDDVTCARIAAKKLNIK